jgi:hypothetical protein
VGAIAVWLAASAVRARAAPLQQPEFPASLEPAVVSAWLQQATTIAPDQVVAVTPSAVTAIVLRAKPRADGVVVLQLRATALSPAASARSGLLTWEMPLEVDCQAGRIRMGETKGYAGRAPDGDPIRIGAAQPDWRPAGRDTPLARAWRATCDPTFRRPLMADGGTRAASVGQSQLEIEPPDHADSAVRSAVPAASSEPGRAARDRPCEVQVVSSPVEADTRRKLISLRAHYGEAMTGLDTRIQSVPVHGETLYRGFVTGFSSRRQAVEFCNVLKRRGGDCLPRRAGTARPG